MSTSRPWMAIPRFTYWLVPHGTPSRRPDRAAREELVQICCRTTCLGRRISCINCKAIHLHNATSQSNSKLRNGMQVGSLWKIKSTDSKEKDGMFTSISIKMPKPLPKKWNVSKGRLETHISCLLTIKPLFATHRQASQQQAACCCAASQKSTQSPPLFTLVCDRICLATSGSWVKQFMTCNLSLGPICWFLFWQLYFPDFHGFASLFCCFVPKGMAVMGTVKTQDCKGTGFTLPWWILKHHLLQRLRQRSTKHGPSKANYVGWRPLKCRNCNITRSPTNSKWGTIKVWQPKFQSCRTVPKHKLFF